MNSDDSETPWWADHYNLETTARFMFAQGHSQENVLYMLQKPWKHNDDFNLAEAELRMDLESGW